MGRAAFAVALLASVAFPAGPQDLADTGADAGAESPKPALTPADYGQWESFGFGPHALSPDGRWLAFPIERVDGSKEIRVRSLQDETEHIFESGRAPRFSADSKHVLWTVEPADPPADPKGEKKGDEPVRNGVGLLELGSGESRQFEAIRAASFDESGRYLALHGYAPKDDERKAADLRVFDLSGDEVTFGNVTEFAWSETGSLLAFVVRPRGDEANGVRLYEPGREKISSLDTSTSSYRGLAWCEDGVHLAVYRSQEEAGGENRTASVLAWRGLGTEGQAGFQLERAPAGTETVRFADLQWSEAGDKVSFGVQELGSEPDGQDSDEDSGEGSGEDDDLPGVQIWHPGDVRIFREQQVNEERDEKRVQLAVWDLDRDDIIRVGTDRFEPATVLKNWRYALEKQDGSYGWGTMFGRPYHDVWAVDLETGQRSRVLERVRHSWPSAGGDYVLTFDGETYACVRLEDGASVDLTGELDTSFANREYDTPTDLLPPYGVGGWLDDDAAVLLYDRYDVWRVAPDGSSAVRLTRGAEQDVQYRVVASLDDEKETFDPDESLLLWTWSERSEKRGYARLSPGADAPESLYFLDKMPGRLTKAKDADVYVFTLEAIDDSPDFFVSGADLSPTKQVTETNPFQSDFAWTRAELVNFDSEAGEPLQAAMYYPVNHDPSRRYPMIVWTYERETPWVHIYDVPDEKDYYNFTTWTQRGYFVLLMDIAYRPRDPGVSAIEAVRPAIRAVVERGLVAEDRVGLVGHSWGGYQAAYLPTRTKLFAASVSGAPLTDFVSFMGQIHWNSGLAEPEHWETGQARMEVPFWEDPEAHLRNSPLHGIDQLETPILLAHGDEDGVVEFFQSTVFYNYARRAGKQVVLLVYEGEDHGFRKEPNRKDYHRRILEWFDHYLQDEPAPEWIRAGTQVSELDEEKRRVAQVASPATDLSLNHFYTVLDEQTYDAIRGSAFLSEQLANVDTGLPDFAAPTEDSSSLYIRGKRTYMEFFGPENRFDEPVGQFGIGLSVDEPAHLDDVERVWTDRLDGEVTRQQTEWTEATPPVPWQDVLVHSSTLASPTIVVWASAYRPEFLPWLYPDLFADTGTENTDGAVRRADFLGPRFASERLLENVTGLILALPPELREKLALQLEAVGYERTESEGVLRLRNSEWTLSLMEATDRTGLVAIELSTTREKEGARVVHFGSRSVLVFGPGRTATWSFL